LIRKTQPDATYGVLELFKGAFPDEDLGDLVVALLSNKGVLCLSAEIEHALVGQIFFTQTSILENADSALLGPLAIAPEYQKQGIGKALILAGLDALKQQRIEDVFVLGDPMFYGRFGFGTEATVSPPYPLPEAWKEAWQSLRVSESAPAQLPVPELWQKPELWS
jgi:putative acetyltransferase